MKKIKGSLSKPEPASLIAIAALSLCALLPLRVYQVTSLIDPKTGFFNGDSFTVPLFYIIGAVVIAVLLVLSFLNSKANRARNCIVKSKLLGVVSVITALSVIFKSVMAITDFIELNSEYFSGWHDIKYTAYLTQSGAASLIGEGVLGLACAVFFCLYAVSCFNKSAKLSSFGLLAATPTVWVICRIVFRFLAKISFVNISDLLLELIMLVFMIMFMLTFAQVVTGVSPEICAWRLFGCGLPAAVIAFVVSVPRLFLIIIGHSDLIVEGYEFELCDLVLAVFIPIFLHNTVTAKKPE
ncbi:MAG: hypothetical protein IIW48_07995 [Clostridia bacterium]|nr:hypothetical protein [Clostridia bacterium]